MTPYLDMTGNVKNGHHVCFECDMYCCFRECVVCKRFFFVDMSMFETLLS